MAAIMVNDPEPRKAANEFPSTNHRTVQAADQIGAHGPSDSASDAVKATSTRGLPSRSNCQDRLRVCNTAWAVVRSCS